MGGAIDMKQQVTDEVRRFVSEYGKRDDVHAKWGEPLVGFADADSTYLKSLKTVIGPTHALPRDVMPDATAVIAYYIPFTRELANTNNTGTHIASPEWAMTYEETNAMFGVLNEHLIDWLGQRGYKGMVPQQAGTYDLGRLMSDWSFRHIAYAAGLGTFGINNMLITEKGCCGRYNTVVTNLDVIPDRPRTDELCLYKKSGKCGVCVKHCPVGALTLDGYDRFKCRSVLMENAAVYTEGGGTYVDDSGEGNSPGTDVCGKCITQSPCAFR
jgi:epoxyqueuosine reductase QueG